MGMNLKSYKRRSENDALRVLCNITYCVVILAFVLMLIDDIRYISTNTLDVTTSMPVGAENFLYVIMHLFPFAFLAVILLLLERKCKKLEIQTWGSSFQAFVKRHKQCELIIVSGIMMVIVLSILYFLPDRFLYYPHFDALAHDMLVERDDERYEELSIYVDDMEFRGWGYRYSDKSPTILYFGGNGQTSDSFFAYLNGEYLQYNWVMIDYPGYGTSDGTPEYENILRAADRAYDFVENSDYYGNGDIIVAGFSLGTGVATYTASRHEVSRLILVAPYDNGISLYNSVLNIFHGPMKVLVRNPYPSDKFAERVRCPVFMVASEDDEVIDYMLSLKLKEHFADAEMVKVQDLNHNEIFGDEAVRKKIMDFI